MQIFHIKNLDKTYQNLILNTDFFSTLENSREHLYLTFKKTLIFQKLENNICIFFNVQVILYF